MNLNNQKNIRVQNIGDDIRIDKWLKRIFSSLNQSFIENKLRRGLIRVNQKKIKSNYRLKENDNVNILKFDKKIFYEKKTHTYNKIIPKNILNQFNESTIFESKDFIIINKWSKISTQGGQKIQFSINDIIKKYSINYNLVHRLDKETSGILIIAKNYNSTKVFGNMFKKHEINKYYIAICKGKPKYQNSIVKLGIKKKHTDLTYQSETKYLIVNNTENYSLILFKPLTGKMHQLRIVSKHLQCPIVGDREYSQSFNNVENLMLHSICINFNYNNKKYNFFAQIPAYMKSFMKKNNLKNTNLENLRFLINNF